MPNTSAPPAPSTPYKPTYAAQVKREEITPWIPSDTEPALYEEETEKEAYMRVMRRVYSEMIPERKKYEPEMQEIQDAYEGLLRMSRTHEKASKVFPLIFILVDAKLSQILAARPRAVFEHTVEKSKIPFIEAMYEHFTTDTDEGVDIDVVDYIWHWYNELYGWSVKRIWYEVEQWMEHEDHPVMMKDEDGEEMYDDEGNPMFEYDADGFAKLEYTRQLRRRGRVRQKVYQPDMVAVDPGAMFMFEARDIVFIEDMEYDEWSVKYRDNPRFENTHLVEPGKFMAPDAGALYQSEDLESGSMALYHAGVDLPRDKVRIVEYYNLDRDEYYVMFNGIKVLHVPNPTPLVDGKKVLPAADLHNRLRPGTFYSRAEGKVVEPIVVMWQRLLNAKARRAELAASPVVLTDTPSGIAPKSFKVMPGAHWKGMKGRAETLNLAGVDTGEVSEYIQELRDLAKATTGVDFDRFIAEPDPTAQQQLAREAASKLRTEKDVALQEKLGHVRSMKITLSNLQYYTTIPEIANISDASDEELEDIKDYDRIDEQTYYKYPRIPLKDKFYVEETYDEESGKITLKASRKRTKTAKDFFFTRSEFLRTKSPIKVRAVSDRKQALSKALRLEQARELMNMAFNLPPENEYDIMTTPEGQKPPKPKYYVNRKNSVARVVDALGEDVKEMTAPEDQEMAGRPAEKFVKEVMGDTPPTLQPTQQQQQQIRDGISISATQQQPSAVDLSRANVSPTPPQSQRQEPKNPAEAEQEVQQQVA